LIFPEEKEDLLMSNITPWRAAICLPVVSPKTKPCDPNVFEEILKQAIKLCLSACLKINNGKICTTLSGGLDSSLCLALIRALVGPDIEIHTFTTGGSVNHPDVIAAQKVSQLLGTIHHQLIPTPAQILEAKQLVMKTWPDEPKSLGNVGVFLTYCFIENEKFRAVIAHDGIDELLGGYWEHRKPIDEAEKIKAFESFWVKLKKDHLLLLERKAHYLGLEVLFPYLQQAVVEYIAQIPVHDRTTRQTSKIPLRIIAEKYLPRVIIDRKKVGFCSVLDAP
jgi:asparagine synthase (glutamine-hydrolysing)